MSNEQFYNIFRNLKDQAFRAADKVDEHFDSLAGTIRDGWTNSTWVPSSVKPSQPPPPPPPSSLSARMGGGGGSDGGGLINWFQNHRYLTAGLAFVGVGGVAVYFMKKGAMKDGKRKRKKAARSLNGARKEVVVVHGAPHEPLVRSVIADLDRKGFIVHVIASNPEDESTITDIASSFQSKNETSGVRSLNLDVSDTTSAQASVDKFAAYLRAQQTAFTGALPHHLRLSGVIIIPDTHFPTGPIETIPMDHWSDTFNLKLVQSLAIAQLFLPLLSEYKSRLLFITPSIPHSLSLPFHAPEVAAVSALGGIIASLRREVKPSGVKVVWIKTGNFDLSSFVGVKEKERAAQGAARADVLTWPANVRAAYGGNYTAQKNPVVVTKGANVRELHWAVFDGITSRKFGEVVRVGRGSVAYDLVGRYAPESLVCWMLGISGQSNDNGASGKAGSDAGSRGISPRGSLEGSVEWEKV